MLKAYHCGDASQAQKAARAFETIFGLTVKEGNSSFFCEEQVEVMKTPHLGEKGHICIGTNSVLRAMNYLENQGIAFQEDTKKYKDGKLLSVYLDMEIGGFALHLA